MHPDIRYFRQLKFLPVLGAVLSFNLCGIAGAAVVHEYTVIVDPGLARLSISANFGATVTRISARSDDARDVLIEARTCANKKLRVRKQRLVLPAEGVRCLNYSVDLEKAAKRERLNEYLSPTNVVASPTTWLWRPELDAATTIRVRFQLPEDIRVSVPWQQEGNNTYRVQHSPESADAPAIFGQFDYHEINIEGAVLRVSLLRAEPAMDIPMILNWIEATATDVTLAYGQFPNPSPQIVVVPISGARDGRGSERMARSKRPVPFGQVIRDGGESVQLFINQTMPLRDFLGDWTATHEFSHLMLPYISRKHKWISEGFAQYYQNILLTRAGEYDPDYAWQKLYDGLERGRLSSPNASPNEAASGSMRDGLMKVYWTGAALALMADVTLRERSNGEETLDHVLGKFQACCLPAAEVWTGPEFLSKLDSILVEPVFMPLYRKHADAVGFPDTQRLLERLGIEVVDGKVRLRDDAELAAIRSSMTRLDAQTARWRQALVDNSM